MREPHRARVRWCAWLAAGVIVLAPQPAVRAETSAPSEADLVRQIKVDVFDENWSAVLKGCEDLLSRFPRSPATPQASFYRARALSRTPGREAEAVAAFREFIARYPDEKMLGEQAWTGVFAIDCDAHRRQYATCATTLAGGLASPSAYVSTLAAIRASDTRDDDLRRRALVVLKRALSTQSEQDIRNEILIAILKIDPKEVPSPSSQKGSAENPPGISVAQHAPTLIRMTIYNKEEGRYDLKINLPVAFAQMLLNSLGDDEKAQLRQEAGRRGINLDDVFQAIQKSGTGRFLQVDTEDVRIEVWIE